eukprot:7428270-Lingulodinium_polyedra.AAC.1
MTDDQTMSEIIWGKDQKPPEVAEDVVVAAQVARDRCNSIFKSAGAQGADEIMSCLSANRSQLLGIDQTFHFEETLITNLCGSNSEARLFRQVLSYLPTQTKRLTIEESLQGVNSLSGGLAYKSASKTAQAKVGVCVKILSRLLEQREPDFGLVGTDENLVKFKRFLSYFVRTATPDGKSWLYGDRAMAQMVKEIMTKHSKTGCSPDDVGRVRAWAHLFPAEHAEAMKTIIKGVDVAASATSP